MESYFGINEDIEEAALEDAQSLAEIVAQKKAWAEENVPSVPKESDVPLAAFHTLAAPSAQPEEVVIDDDDDNNTSLTSVHTAHSASSSGSLQTLAAKKRATVEKSPRSAISSQPHYFSLPAQIPYMPLVLIPSISQTERRLGPTVDIIVVRLATATTLPKHMGLLLHT